MEDCLESQEIMQLIKMARKIDIFLKMVSCKASRNSLWQQERKRFLLE